MVIRLHGILPNAAYFLRVQTLSAHVFHALHPGTYRHQQTPCCHSTASPKCRGTPASEHLVSTTAPAPAHNLTPPALPPPKHSLQGVQFTLPFTLAVYMVRDFLSSNSGSAVGEQEVGRLTGLLGACFNFGQLFSSYPLGQLSDYIGRKVSPMHASIQASTIT